MGLNSRDVRHLLGFSFPTTQPDVGPQPPTFSSHQSPLRSVAFQHDENRFKFVLVQLGGFERRLFVEHEH
jgi:hypothetical protein